MSSDTKWIIGTGVALMASVLGSAVAVIAVVVTLVGGVREDVRTLRDDLHAAVDGLRDDMREDHARFDARLDALEVAVGKVDQRLLTIERVVLPAPAAGE